jgi:hypothetical protein
MRLPRFGHQVFQRPPRLPLEQREQQVPQVLRAEVTCPPRVRFLRPWSKRGHALPPLIAYGNDGQARPVVFFQYLRVGSVKMGSVKMGSVGSGV